MGSRIGERVGAYELVRSLGKGGFGEVFEAKEEDTGDRVALKLLLPNIQPNREHARRFLQEAETLEQLHHPGIVRPRKFGKLADETIYIVMEYLEGRTLHAWMRDHQGRVSIADALAICAQIAAAMVEVHAKDIIHRDLTPGNVFLLDEPSGLRVKVLDFGIAKVPLKNEVRLETDLATAPSQMLGTEGYKSPEHYKGAEQVVMASDVYSLGLILFELITGQRPFADKTGHDLIRESTTGTPRFLRDLVPTAPAALATFVSAMLATEPSLRPSMLRVQEKLAGPWDSDENECLLPGLESFSGSQAELFFGRQTEAQEILARLDRARNGDQRWIQIEGPSGVGKTSLVQAGVLTKLEEQRLADGSRRWRVARLRPSDDPVRGLAQALFLTYQGPDFELTSEDLERSLREDGDAALVKLAKAHTPPSELLLLVIEQMEDLFAFAPASPLFDALVSTALTEPGSPVRLLSTLRSEFRHRLDKSPKLEALLDEDSRYQILSLEQAKLKQVVVEMAKRVGMKLADNLADLMSADAASADSSLPLLGYALRELWSPLNEVITIERYISSGGVRGTLTRHANRLLKSLSEEERHPAKWIILDLIHVGRGVPDTRRPRTLRQVRTAAGDNAITEKVLMHLEGKSVTPSASTAHNLRLLVRSNDSALSADAPQVEFIHEVLLRDERIIAHWIDEERPRLERLETLELAAQDWEEENDQTTERLPLGSLLDHYRFHDVADKIDRDRLQRMSSARAKRFLQKAEWLSIHRQRIKWALWAALAVGVASVLFFAIFAREEQIRAEQNLFNFLSTADKMGSDTDWVLSRTPYTLDLRKRILNELEQNLERLPQRDRAKIEVREVDIKIKQRYSDLYREDGTLSEARQLLEESKKGIDAGMVSDPSNKKLQQYLSLYYSKLGKIELAQGNFSKVKDAFTDARRFSVDSGIGAKNANDIRIQATNDKERADLEMAQSLPAEALPIYENAVSSLEHLVSDKDDDTDYNWSLLSETLCASATASRKIGDQEHLKLSQERIERALEIQAPILRRELGNAYYASTMARIYLEHAELLYQEEQLDSATSEYEKALHLGRELHEVDPTRKPYGLVLGESLQGYEKLLLRKGDPAGAQEVARERRELAQEFLRKDVEDVRFRRLLDQYP